MVEFMSVGVAGGFKIERGDRLRLVGADGERDEEEEPTHFTTA